MGRLCCKRTLFSYFVQSVLSLIVRNGILSQIKISVIEARITCILYTNGVYKYNRYRVLVSVNMVKNHNAFMHVSRTSPTLGIS